jgi:hypothetical protein
MKHAWFVAAALAGLALAAACGDDDTSTPTTATGTGGAGAGCGFMLSGGYGGFGDVCMGEPGESECLSCTRSSCCMEAEACAPDTTCSCLLECFLAGCDPIGCLQSCGQNDQVNALTKCAQENCPVCLQ